MEGKEIPARGAILSRNYIIQPNGKFKVNYGYHRDDSKIIFYDRNFKAIDWFTVRNDEQEFNSNAHAFFINVAFDKNYIDKAGITTIDGHEIYKPGISAESNNIIRALYNSFITKSDVESGDLVPQGGYSRFLYEAAGAVWHPESIASDGTLGAYWLNGLKDITVKQMDAIYFYTNDYPILTLFNSASSIGQASAYRTTIPKYRTEGMVYPRIVWSYAEVIKLFLDSKTQIHEATIENAIIYCPNLKVLGDHLNNKRGYFKFEMLPDLITIYMRLYHNISFPNSSKLSKESILYMITECQAESAITITLHPDAYAMAMADTGIQSALAEKTFVSLASA